MNIFITGQCSLHWGRMEFGNIGNFYIMEPFLRELHKTFPNCSIKTTFQMSETFCNKENVQVVPLEQYYSWSDDDYTLAKRELEISEEFKRTGKIVDTTGYIDNVLWSDIVIDFSGDIWGDNANLLGENRFKIGLLKDKVAQNFGKKTAMLFGSPGPFSDEETKELAKEIYSRFDLVTNREPISTKLLEVEGFDTTNTTSLACPAFLFEPTDLESIKEELYQDGFRYESKEKPVVGFILCGWNFEVGPFDRWPRDDSEYVKFAKIVEYLTEECGVKVCLMSHSNGFEVPVVDFKLIHGRDYPVTKQLEKVIRERGISRDFFTLDGVYDAWQTKAIVGKFDMLVSGRVHAAVAGLSQHVPTVVIDYGHEPKAHKLLGFATVAGAQDYVADPSNGDDLLDKVNQCWISRESYKADLIENIVKVKQKSRLNFELLKDLFK